MNKLNSIHKQIPLGVLLIAVFYLFGAIVLLISLFSNPVEVSRSIANAHGLPATVDGFILPAVIGIALLISYGLYSRAKWGYFFTLAYLKRIS